MVFVLSFVLIGFSLWFASSASQYAHDLPDASRTFGLVSLAIGMTGLLGGLIGGTLRMLVGRIDALEEALKQRPADQSGGGNAAD
jgi:hypothetical protein